jgi:pSer/pThr/pTyr-binding forkhead associated (FHA) protein
MDVVLVMFKADGEKRKFSVTRDMTVIGRREDCDLRIPLGDVSRKHCRLIKDGDVVRIEDLGSSNGTYHDGEKIKDATLFAGSSVRIGPVTFVVQIDGVPAEEDMKPLLDKPITLDDSDFLAVEDGKPGEHAEEHAEEHTKEHAEAKAEPEAEVPIEVTPMADVLAAAAAVEPEPALNAAESPHPVDPDDSVEFEFDLSEDPPAEGAESIDDILEFHLDEEESPSASASGQHQA